MKHFNVGDKLDVKLSTMKRFGEIAGECEIISVNEISYDELEWKETSVRNCFLAIGGEITVILRTQTNNEKPKKFQLNISKNSDDWCNKFKCNKEEYWFSPGKRNYQTINSSNR